MNFLRGIVYSLFPKELRRSWQPLSNAELIRPAAVAGLLEMIGFLAWSVHRYAQFLVLRAHQLHPLAAANEGTQLYMSGVLTVEYVFQPLSLVLIYFAVEGAARFGAAFLTDEVLPSLPCKLFAVALGWRKKRVQEKSLGPMVPDQCEVWEDGLRIACSRVKDGWRPSGTIAVAGEFYVIEKQEQAAAPRSIVYLLRKLPAGRIIRGFSSYEPLRKM